MRTTFASVLFFVGVGAACGKVETPPADIDAPDAPTATLIVTPSGSGGGTVTSTPAGINCGSDCSEEYALGTAVTLTATPDGGSTFVGWNGGGCSGTGPCTVTLGADAAVGAMFAMNSALDVVVEGTGTGTVTSSPGGIDCGTDCTEVFPAGTVVTLTAMADVSSSFSGWSGSGCSGTGTCVVTVDQARAVTASFTLNRYALAVTRSGSGSGIVRSSPAGIDCGADCTEEYDHGTAVTLTATASTGSTFVGWSGGGCSGTADCVVSVTGITTVTATFAINQLGVTVMRAGNGTGTVTSNPAGINCGADCSELYNFGTVVTLTAATAAGSVFSGWSGGGCAGTGTCVVTVNAAVAVTATFTLTQHTLTVTRAGSGTGTVTSAPAGINCGADCSEVYNYGQLVGLTASPASGNSFTGWSGGGCSGTGACTVAMTSAQSVTATFSACTGTTTFSYTGALQTFTVPACATSITIDAYGAQGGTAVGETGTLNYAGGLGARVRGTFSVAAGQQITVLVGGRGASATPPPNASCGAGGGGGSFVVRSGAALVVAGGGGGAFHCNYYGGANGGDGQITTNGQAGVPSTGGMGVSPACHPGGTNGGGGRSYFGGGGGGFTGAGTADYTGTGTTGGGAYPGAGGNIGGGFGGGGGRFDYCCGGSGGGGGYSGGSGGTSDGCAGGGGGSINNGSNQINTAAARSGDGVVIITY